MATFTAKVLADGQLANSKGTLYTVPAVTKAYIRQIKVFSTGAGQTVKIYIKPGATSRTLAQFVLGNQESGQALDEPLLLEAGDLIEGETTTATTVDYIITGIEET